MHILVLKKVAITVLQCSFGKNVYLLQHRGCHAIPYNSNSLYFRDVAFKNNNNKFFLNYTISRNCTDYFSQLNRYSTRIIQIDRYYIARSFFFTINKHKPITVTIVTRHVEQIIKSFNLRRKLLLFQIERLLFLFPRPFLCVFTVD